MTKTRIITTMPMRAKFVVLALLATVLANAQFSDLAKIDYTRLPIGNSEVGYDRIRGLFNYPIKVKEGSYFLVGLDYSKIELTFTDQSNSFDIAAIEDFQLLDINLGYTFKMKNNWRFGARFTPGYSSNLVKELSFEDVVFSGDIVFIKDRTKDPIVAKPQRLILGVSYSENRGFPFPLPFISYYKKFHSKWSYNLGVPKSNLQYHISNTSRLKLITELDGFTANIQGGLLVNNDQIAHRINMAIIVGGLRYEYKFTKNVELHLNMANIFTSSAQLRDSKYRAIIEVNKNNRYYFRTGLRLKI